MTKIIYQVQGKEYANQSEATAALVSVLGVAVHNVDWLDVTTINDAANDIRRYVSGVVNDEIEPDGDSDLERYLQRYRQAGDVAIDPIPAVYIVQSADDGESDEA
jgi:hypothetical protein